MIPKPYLASFLSFLPFVYCTYIVSHYFLSLINFVNKKISEIYIIFFFVSIISAEILKKIFYNKFEGTQRPHGAKGCDFFSLGPDVSGKPGFPSGHLTITSYICVINILHILYKSNASFVKKISLVTLNILLIISMGWARHYKKCHNLIQILGGTILGTLIALFSFFYF